MKGEALLKAKREEILGVCAKCGAHNVRIFASIAPGEANERSDIDFLVEMEPGRILLDLGGLQYDLEQLLSCEWTWSRNGASSLVSEACASRGSATVKHPIG